MGGHHSKQTVGVSTNVVANIVQTTAQNCISVSNGTNTITVDGNYNVISGVKQEVSISVNTSCTTFSESNVDFNTDLAAVVESVLKDQEVALESWVDNSGSSQKSKIAQDVTTNVTKSTVQNCVSSLTGINNLFITGNENIVRDIVQSSTLNLISQCLLTDTDSVQAVTNITDTVNQHASYESENPLAFITDAYTAVSKSAILMIAVIFIIIISFVFVLMLVGRLRRRPPPPYAHQN
jgi:hypothetical protein